MNLLAYLNEEPIPLAGEWTTTVAAIKSLLILLAFGLIFQPHIIMSFLSAVKQTLRNYKEKIVGPPKKCFGCGTTKYPFARTPNGNWLCGNCYGQSRAAMSRQHTNSQL